MKLLTTLFSLAFIIISLVPCTDEVSGDTCGSEVHFHVPGTENHAEADLCSPFCFCTCCSTNVASSHTFNKVLSTVYNQEHQTCYLGTPGKDVPYSILQPPQV